MRPLFFGVQCAVLIGVLIFSYFLGAPLYSDIVNRINNYSASFRFNPSPAQKDGAFPPQQDVQINGKHGHVLLDKETLLHKPIWERPPPGSSLPPIEYFSLSNEMVAARAKKKVIVVTFGNYAFLDFVLNWVRHLTDVKVSNILVGAMDLEILEALFLNGVPVFNMGSNADTIDVGWGSPAFHKMGREKVILVDKFLSMGYELLMCDTDMVWIQNPLPYFARFPSADVLVSSDEVASTVDDDGLEFWQRAHGAYNIGIFIWRPSETAKKFAKEWKKQLLADDKVWDQNGFNDLMRKGHLGPSIEGSNGLFFAYEGRLKLGVLPVSIFCSGHTYFVQALYEKLHLKAYAVHTTFQFAGTPGKRHRLREAKLFYDKPEYYNAPGGFLTYQASIPDDLLTSGPHSVHNHFKLVNFQLKQVRDALAIASVLNRTLVMPKLWCRLDRLWFGHPGVLPGTKTSQPFVCPMDHVFEVHTMLDGALDEQAFGPAIRFREYSFLENPRLPKEVKNSKLNVKICKRNSVGCGSEVDGSFKLPQNSTEEEIFSALSEYKHVKILKLASLTSVFKGFENKEMETKFRARVKRYTGIWCCKENLQIGHIYYDIYWDEKPDWKPVPPATREEDHPPL